MNKNLTRTSSNSAGTSRRDFLKKSGAGLSFAIAFGAGSVNLANATSTPSLKSSQFGVWVTLDSDGGILILNPAAEMGQGSMTALPVIIAEEMDADWSMVRIENSPIEPGTFGRKNWGPQGSMLTVGSATVMGYFTALRLVGAQIRQVLLDNVAQQWSIPVGELTTEPSKVVHAKSQRKIGYGEIADFASIPAELPTLDESALKSPKDFRLIGSDMSRSDIPSKTNGTATFGLDISVPNMRYAMMKRTPIHGGKVKSFNEEEVLAMDGIESLIMLDYGVGVIGTSMPSVAKARQSLVIEWEEGAAAKGFDSIASIKEYASIPESGKVEPRSLSAEGDVVAGMNSATKIYEADYLNDHVYHAQMEPLNAVASVSTDGASAEVWAGTQGPWGARNAIADTLGIDVQHVKFNPCYLGGGFGRRSNPDYIIEAVKLSDAVKLPVKLLWTREDDLQYGQYRPMSLQRMRAGVNEEGQIVAWSHCIVGDGGGLLGSGAKIQYYTMPNQSIEICSVESGMRLKHWRAVGHGPNKFAIEAFIDEIANDLGEDPYEYRRKLMRDDPRSLAVLDKVAEISDWGGPVPEGRARGIAFAERSQSLTAAVAEVSVDRNSGVIKVHKIWAATDGGIIVQPNNAHAQLEGGIVTGLSSTLFERITVKDGQAQQSNFHDYSIMRMSDMPEIENVFMDSVEAPTGLGESGVPIAGGAVANAFATLTGKRLRHLPFSPDRVLEVLAD